MPEIEEKFLLMTPQTLFSSPFLSAIKWFFNQFSILLHLHNFVFFLKKFDKTQFCCFKPSGQQTKWPIFVHSRTPLDLLWIFKCTVELPQEQLRFFFFFSHKFSIYFQFFINFSLPVQISGPNARDWRKVSPDESPQHSLLHSCLHSLVSDHSLSIPLPLSPLSIHHFNFTSSNLSTHAPCSLDPKPCLLSFQSPIWSHFPQTSATLPPDFCNPSSRLLQPFPHTSANIPPDFCKVRLNFKSWAY